jgi:cytochrome b561
MIPVRNTSERYGQVAMLLHWSIMILFAILVTLGLIMTNMEDSDFKWELYSLHKSFGMVVMMLIVLRIIWRWVNPVPILPANLTGFEKILAHGVHLGLYAVMIVMPISGLLDSYGGGYKTNFFDLFVVFPKVPARSKELELYTLALHVYGSYLFYILFFLHLAGVLKHHLILKDNVLRRMLPVKLKTMDSETKPQ